MSTPTVVWLLPAAPFTHYELIGEIAEAHLHALSQKVPVWGIAWNENWPGRTYTLTIWNAHGRMVGFTGGWQLSALTREVEQLWKMEGFQPQVVIGGRSIWQKRLAQRWQRRYKGLSIASLPLSKEVPVFLGKYSFPDDPAPEKGTVCLWVQPEGAEEAAFIADLLALQKYRVYVVGTPRQITPLRSVVVRFPKRVHLRTGLPWIETQPYIERSQAVVYVGMPFDESVLLRAGTPWIVPAAHPLASYAGATYTQPQIIPDLLSQRVAAAPSLSIHEAVERLLSLLGPQPC